MSQGLSFIFAISGLSVIVFGFCLKTPFPLFQLAFAIQLLFMSLGCLNSMNPIISSLTELSPIKGLRSTKIYFEDWISPN